ncbi:RING finger protein [Halorubrum salsamenti]|uniref:hypothetical protein n=1 Tax=Halorubrum salsamenti TaxID=2583990 RepID=UPI0011A7657D|nr:hypothetical protein [Halorubrum salsamenti]
MLVSEDHIVERIDVDERDLHDNPPGVHLRYNNTQPTVMSDGIDFIAVIETDTENVYRLDYWGYEFGRLQVTRGGVEEIGALLTTNTRGVPNWTLDSSTIDKADPPWWIPKEAKISPTETCGLCGDTFPASDVFTPRNLPPEADSHIVCQDCWRRR